MKRNPSRVRRSIHGPRPIEDLSATFQRPYGKPKALTDRYDECRPEEIERLLCKPETEFGWSDFQTLFRVGVAPATYEEGLYFLPAAFGFLRRNPDGDGVHCVADVLWFLSEYAARLRADGLLETSRGEVQALLAERTARFVVVHRDHGQARQMGQDRDRYASVEGSELVCHTLEALLRFETLGAWATEFLADLGQSRNEPRKSAWYLECVKDARHWALFRSRAESARIPPWEGASAAAGARLHELWKQLHERGQIHALPQALEPESSELELHAAVIRRSGALFDDHATYWESLFAKLGLADGSHGA